MSVKLKLPTVLNDEAFEKHGCDMDEIRWFVGAFLAGESGDWDDEDEVLGFLSRDLKDQNRHGVYETKTAGRIHIVGDSEQVVVMPDITFAQIDRNSKCSVNTCNCKTTHHKPKKSDDND